MSEQDDDLDALRVSFDDAPVEDSHGDLAERLTRRFFWRCENPLTRGRTLRLVEASVSDRESAQRFYGFLNRRMVGILGRRIEVSAARMELIGAQLIGTAMLRYVLQVEPVSSLPLERLLPMVASGVRGVLGSEPGVLPQTAAGSSDRFAGPGSAEVVEAWMQVKRGGRPY